MAIERSASHLHALAHIRLKPTLINLSKGDGLGMVDGIHQPDVFLELSICCHTSSFSIGQIYELFLGVNTFPKDFTHILILLT